ncbi:MAG: hypothetical protein F6K35_31510 [Okeania sp. SIO2H7]|nr:hypothetical protein [Okeania sp. SIO2H7]
MTLPREENCDLRTVGARSRSTDFVTSRFAFCDRDRLNNQDLYQLTIKY